MTTPAGQLKFSDIQTEFGPNVGSQHNLGQYRVNQTVGDRSWRLDDNVPVPGQEIRFSDLLGKTLNCVVDYGSEETRVSSGTKFDNSATVIGGFKSIPSRSNNTQTKKVYHLIRNILGATDSDTAVALRTNTWDASTLLLRYIITANGDLYGRGGIPNSGNGSPAFGVEQSCQLNVESGGSVRGGGGAGGKGGDYSFGSFNFSYSASGGTGGTGRGYNNQDGADPGGAPTGNIRGGGNNCNPGGGGGSDAGYGGNGGDWATNGNNGCNAGSTGPITGFPLFESETLGSGTSGGAGGAAIIRSNSGLTVTITNNGTISGDQNTVGAFT